MNLAAAHTFDPGQARTNLPDADEAQDQVELEGDAEGNAPEADSPILLEDPLEAILAESLVEQAEKVLAVPATDADPFESLFAQVTADIARDKGMRGKRKRLLADAGEMKPAEREALRREILSWEAKEEWLPQAVVAVITCQECSSCGAAHDTLDGIFERQQSRKVIGAVRWVRWSPEFGLSEGLQALPKEVARRRLAVGICPGCVVGAGFVNEVPSNW